jgi:hypothetical protein
VAAVVPVTLVDPSAAAAALPRHPEMITRCGFVGVAVVCGGVVVVGLDVVPVVVC